MEKLMYLCTSNRPRVDVVSYVHEPCSFSPFVAHYKLVFDQSRN